MAAVSKIMLSEHTSLHQNVGQLEAAAAARLDMQSEKPCIRNTVSGFGPYDLDHKASRARFLPSAKETICYPDQVWERCPIATTATWVYVKEFDSKPYPFTVALLTVRPKEGGIIVPVSSFPCKRKDVRKWQKGNLLYQKQDQPPEGG